jgi:hypothetical protein
MYKDSGRTKLLKVNRALPTPFPSVGHFAVPCRPDSTTEPADAVRYEDAMRLTGFVCGVAICHAMPLKLVVSRKDAGDVSSVP